MQPEIATTEPDERRSSPRIAVDEQAAVLVVGHGMSFLGRVLDLSLNGCRVQAATQLPGGGRVRVEVAFTVNGLPFRMGGAIRWSDGESMGIQFVRVSPSRLAEWGRVIEELHLHAERSTEGALSNAAPLRERRNDLVQIRDHELLTVVDANLADAARRAGPMLACHVGCTQCCHGAFAINALDVARLRVGMRELRATAPELAAAVEDRAHAWIAEYGEDYPGDLATGTLGVSQDDQVQFEGFANEAACPALDPTTGRCDVYAWRPMTCRVFGPPVRSANRDGEEGLGHCELCFVGATPDQIAACEMPVAHDQETELLRQMGDTRESVVAFALLKSI